MGGAGRFNPLLKNKVPLLVPYFYSFRTVPVIPYSHKTFSAVGEGIGMFLFNVGGSGAGTADQVKLAGFFPVAGDELKAVIVS